MIFELSWTWFEDYVPHLFEGPEKTKEEWEKDCEQALRNASDEVLTASDRWLGANEWCEVACDRLEEMGYKRVKPVKYGIFGAFIIRGDGEDDERFSRIIGEDAYQKVIKHNQRIEEDMRKEDEEETNV